MRDENVKENVDETQNDDTPNDDRFDDTHTVIDTNADETQDDDTPNDRDVDDTQDDDVKEVEKSSEYVLKSDDDDDKGKPSIVMKSVSSKGNNRSSNEFHKSELQARRGRGKSMGGRGFEI